MTAWDLIKDSSFDYASNLRKAEEVRRWLTVQPAATRRALAVDLIEILTDVGNDNVTRTRAGLKLVVLAIPLEIRGDKGVADRLQETVRFEFLDRIVQIAREEQKAQGMCAEASLFQTLIRLILISDLKTGLDLSRRILRELAGTPLGDWLDELSKECASDEEE